MNENFETLRIDTFEVFGSKPAIAALRTKLGIEQTIRVPPLGHVFKDREGKSWVYMGNKQTPTGKTDHEFVQVGTRYYYHASGTATLLRKFPGLQEFADE